jgi:hypothetical protein
LNGWSEIDATFSENPSFGSKIGLIRWKMPLFSEEYSAPFEKFLIPAHYAVHDIVSAHKHVHQRPTVLHV